MTRHGIEAGMAGRPRSRPLPGRRLAMMRMGQRSGRRVGETPVTLGVCLALVVALGLISPCRAELLSVTGNCGVLDSELTDAQSHLFTTEGSVAHCEFIPGALTPGGREILADSDGGSATYSEVIAYELLAQCESALLLKTDSAIGYLDAGGKRAAALLSISGVRIGLSVKRAVGYPYIDPLTLANAQLLLDRALQDVIYSSANVGPEDAWAKQILVLETPSAGSRDILITAYSLASEELKSSTIVWIVVTFGDCGFIYDGGAPFCSAVVSVGESTPQPSLDRNAPNPFNPRTTIRFDLPAAGPVRLAVYDLAGRLVRVLVEGERAAGSYEAVWDGRDTTGRSAPSGSYLARLVAGAKVERVRLSLVR
jgi:hypothetical protein